MIGKCSSVILFKHLVSRQLSRRQLWKYSRKQLRKLL